MKRDANLTLNSSYSTNKSWAYLFLVCDQNERAYGICLVLADKSRSPQDSRVKEESKEKLDWSSHATTYINYLIATDPNFIHVKWYLQSRGSDYYSLVMTDWCVVTNPIESITLFSIVCAPGIIYVSYELPTKCYEIPHA